MIDSLYQIVTSYIPSNPLAYKVKYYGHLIELFDTETNMTSLLNLCLKYKRYDLYDSVVQRRKDEEVPYREFINYTKRRNFKLNRQNVVDEYRIFFFANLCEYLMVSEYTLTSFKKYVYDNKLYHEISSLSSLKTQFIIFSQ